MEKEKIRCDKVEVEKGQLLKLFYSLVSYNKRKKCLNCKVKLKKKMSDAKYCSDSCRYKFAHKNRKEQLKNKIQSIKTTQPKIGYSKMTFILSIIGFIGSVGFYLGVLRQVYSKPNNIEVQVSDLIRENKELKTQITVLTKMVEKCKEDE